MLVVGIIGPGASIRAVIRGTNSRWKPMPKLSVSLPPRQCQLPAKLQLRRYGQPTAPRQPQPLSEQAKRARLAVQSAKNYDIPERLIIYHAGTGRIAFLAMLKLTSLLLGAFFTFLVVPSYVKAEKPVAETAAGMLDSLFRPTDSLRKNADLIVALAGIIPILFIGYTTAPFVTHVHIHLPSVARTSRPVLERFIHAMPPSTLLTFTTMSVIAKPRYSSVTVGELFPARGKRFGLVNYMRDTEKENRTRKWYMYRAVGSFYVQEGGRARGKRYEKKGKIDSWVWDAVKGKVERIGG
ncbi:hypothetical protein QQS21_006953 [Conoideocrella luteorostrata]|uniref:Uncharacterized protein n=1 Tax=Conoideocrella luteorostrata TaxID=1105319 RepID=A0AAJ0CP17_9HYPO|nr:hypothetical protein QQS21_006953 [Conoideocrella luteorostrata]